MKLTVRCRSGLRIDFEGDLDELERFDGFLAELARLERDRLSPETVPAEVTHTVVVPFEPFPDPSPPTAPEPAAKPDAQPAPDAVPPPTRTAPRAGGRDGLTDKQQQLIDAVTALGECSVAQVCEHTGRTDANAVGAALRELRDRGLVAHNGLRAKLARYRPKGNGPVDGKPFGKNAPTIPPVDEDARDQQTRDRVLRLVAEHGPVAPAWVADQLVKNRRDTALLMRKMEQAGELREYGTGFWEPLAAADREAPDEEEVR